MGGWGDGGDCEGRKAGERAERPLLLSGASPFRGKNAMVFPPAPCAPAQIYAILPNSRVRRIEKSRGLGECEHEAGVAEAGVAPR